MTPFDGYFFEDPSVSTGSNLQLSPTVKLNVEEASLEAPNASTKPVSRSGSDRMFVVDCRSNSLASEEKEEASTSLFGEKEKEKEILYTNFNEIFKQEASAPSQYVADPISIEKEIQETSQQILTPKIDARPPSEGKKLLEGLLQTESSKLWGTSFLSKGLSNVGRRINLDFSDEEKKSESKLAISLIDSENSEDEKKWEKEVGVKI